MGKYKKYRKVARKWEAAMLKKGFDSYEDSRNIVRIMRENMGLKPRRRAKRSIEFFSDSELQRFLDAAYAWPGRGEMIGLMCETLYETAMRAGKFSQLRIEDINLVDRRIIIRDAKGGKSRYVPIMAGLTEKLASYTGDRTHGPLFVSERGEAFSKRRLQQIVTDVGVAASLHAHPHKLRRTRATWLLNQGMSLEAISKFLGHSSVAVTQQFYAEMLLGRVEQEMEKVYAQLQLVEEPVVEYRVAA